jgi:hypothetical protein
MQSNNSTVTNSAITRDQLFELTFSSSASSPPTPPPPMIPAPPPMPAQFLTIQSIPWSTLQLPKSYSQGRSRSNTNLCKFLNITYLYFYFDQHTNILIVG